MISTSFLLQDSLKKAQFFKKPFLLTDTNMEVVLGMSFQFLSNLDIKFGTETLPRRETPLWRPYL